MTDVRHAPPPPPQHGPSSALINDQINISSPSHPSLATESSHWRNFSLHLNTFTSTDSYNYSGKSKGCVLEKQMCLQVFNIWIQLDKIPVLEAF